MAIANTAQPTASTLSKFPTNRGHTKPRNAAGTAESNPNARISPMACAPRAPARVKRFQKTKTPIPVYQKPFRMASTPRGSCPKATPVDSSIVI